MRREGWGVRALSLFDQVLECWGSVGLSAAMGGFVGDRAGGLSGLPCPLLPCPSLGWWAGSHGGCQNAQFKKLVGGLTSPVCGGSSSGVLDSPG